MPAERRYKIPTEDRLTRSAVHYLERYASTEANLRRVLERKVSRACHALELPPDEYRDLIETIVAKCVRNGMVNDRGFAEMKLASLRRKGQSKKKIEAQLRAKGVPVHIIEVVVAEDTSEDRTAAIAYAKRRRFGPFRDHAKRDDRRLKDIAAMCRAGFDYETARQIIDADLDDFSA
ncbi:regulatory protein RecX [Roseibium alexandrii]|uniref:Regulatory protein RecX n=1 Tax=Roseibium alexandrii TaxID=388408 RepID=A0A0M6ZS81_9HYPH|nr:regulatory protein RecX [Roseibium alexandrii]CTQ64384.1 recombination regulator RecX [Roseibium alexandrii]